MNERVKELAVEAGLYIELLDTLHPRAMSAEECDTAYKKFAELIVRECVETVKWTPSMFPNDTVIKNIKEHFGM